MWTFDGTQSLCLPLLPSSSVSAHLSTDRRPLWVSLTSPPPQNHSTLVRTCVKVKLNIELSLFNSPCWFFHLPPPASSAVLILLGILAYRSSPSLREVFIKVFKSKIFFTCVLELLCIKYFPLKHYTSV